MNADERIPTEIVEIQRDPEGISATLRVDDPVTVQMLASVGPRRAFSVYHVTPDEAAALNAHKHARIMPNPPTLDMTVTDPADAEGLMKVVTGEPAEVKEEVKEDAGKAPGKARPRGNTRVRNGGGDTAGGSGDKADGEPGDSSDAG